MTRPRNAAAPPSLFHLLSRSGGHSAARLVNAPKSIRRVAWVLAMVLPLWGVLLLVLPWQQAAPGSGRVIALSMAQRQQAIDAPVKGIIEGWYVREGQRVQAGDLIVALTDNDPEFFERLDASRAMGGDQLQMLAEQVRSYERKLTAAEIAADLRVAEAMSKVRGLQRKQIGLEAAAEVEALQADRLQILADEGIASQREAEVGVSKSAKARAMRLAIEAEIDAARHAQGKAQADGQAKVATVQAELESAKAKHAAQGQKQLDLEVKVGRQETQQVRAPQDGVVLRMYGGPGGAQIKQGELLVTFVPDAQDQAVELWIDGNDMPLVQEGEQVRLLFEGWPALQMVGFPGADAGTYAGRVAFVNATDDGKGKFRVVVVPDPAAADWPEPKRLRQGVRAKGWVLLGQVSLGYELWRRTNGFPSLPPVEKGEAPLLPSSKKPKAPKALK